MRQVPEKFKENNGHYKEKEGAIEVWYNSDDAKDGEKFGVLLISKEKKEGKEYSLRLAESCLNLNADILQFSISPTSTGLDNNLIMALKMMGSFCGYLVNSSSWASGKVQDYDRDEFISRLEKIKRFI